MLSYQFHMTSKCLCKWVKFHTFFDACSARTPSCMGSLNSPESVHSLHSWIYCCWLRRSQHICSSFRVLKYYSLYRNIYVKFPHVLKFPYFQNIEFIYFETFYPIIRNSPRYKLVTSSLLVHYNPTVHIWLYRKRTLNIKDKNE